MLTIKIHPDLLCNSWQFYCQKCGSQIPFYDLSFLGGFNYVRGFDTYRYRGNNALIGSLELRQTMHSFRKEHRGLDLIGFGDAGQVWGHNRSTADPMIMGQNNFASRNWKAGIGGAVQYRHTKSLAVRLDVATSQDGQYLYFSVSRGF